MKAGQVGQVGRVGLVGFVGTAVVFVAATASVLIDGARALQASVAAQAPNPVSVLNDGARAFQASVAAQASNPIAPANFVRIQAPVVALTHVRVIDGTGAPARTDQTIVIRDGNIADLGAASAIAPPAGATIVDLAGESVIPGLVMMHEHLYYDTLGDPDVAPEERPHVIGRRRFGQVTIANSDAGAAAFTNQAIDEAHRAVEELFVKNGLS